MDEEVPPFRWEDVEIPADVEVTVRPDDGYKTCSACGGDCEPEPTGAAGLGVRVAFVCPEHGLHSIIDPFEGRRQPPG